MRIMIYFSFSTGSIIPWIASLNKCSLFVFTQFISHLQRKENSCYIMLKISYHERSFFVYKNLLFTNKCQKQHNTNKQTQPKKQKRRERFIFLLSFSIRSISFMLFSITSCPVSVILIMHIHFTFHLRLYKYYEGDSNFILKILIC